MKATQLISLEGKNFTLHGAAKKRLSPKTVAAIAQDLWGSVPHPKKFKEAVGYALQKRGDVTIHQEDDVDGEIVYPAKAK